MTSATASPQLAGLAFGNLADRYDAIFTHSLIGRAQRNAVWEVARCTFRPGSHILELNCGTGEDALFFARLGISVFACDASEKMIEVANGRRSREAPRAPVRFEVLPTEHIAVARQFGPFDGVFSNFSGLNCVSDNAEVARQLATLVPAGSPLLLCFSSRFCLWEVLWFLVCGKAPKAIRRWNGHAAASLGKITVEVQYPTVAELRKAFSPHFRLRSRTGIGVTVPPSYLENLARRFPGILSQLCVVDRLVSGWPVFRVCGDHVLLRFERVGP